MMLTIVNSSFEVERTNCRCGNPSIDVSIGKVTSCSTSTGDIPGACADTTTWLFVRSGKASTGRLSMARMPAARSRTIPMRISQRLERKKSNSLVIPFLPS